jgi:hypothetical protein
MPRTACANCRHPRPLHSNGQSACKARGCHAGPDDGPCTAFMEASSPGPAPLIPLFQAPGFPASPVFSAAAQR